MAIMTDCLSVDRGSIPRRVATVPPPSTECCYSGLNKAGKLQGQALQAEVGLRIMAR